MDKQELLTIRADFPILDEKIYNKDLIYFDNGATTQKPRAVVEKIEEGYYHLNANIHRGVHYLSQKATEAHEAARITVAEFLKAAKHEEIIFTRVLPRLSTWWQQVLAKRFVRPAMKWWFLLWSIILISFRGRCCANEKA